MKSIRDYIIENENSTFNSPVDISFDQFKSLKKELEKKYNIFYNEIDQLYLIYDKTRKTDMKGFSEHLGTYVCKTGKLFYDNNAELSKYIDKYIK